MDGTYIVVTSWGEFGREIDTMVSGVDAAQHAWKHRKMLIAEFDMDAKSVVVLACTGGDHGAAGDWLEERLNDGKPVGRKAFATAAAIGGEGCKVSFLTAKDAASAK